MKGSILIYLSDNLFITLLPYILIFLLLYVMFDFVFFYFLVNFIFTFTFDEKFIWNKVFSENKLLPDLLTFRLMERVQCYLLEHHFIAYVTIFKYGEKTFLNI